MLENHEERRHLRESTEALWRLYFPKQSSENDISLMEEIGESVIGEKPSGMILGSSQTHSSQTVDWQDLEDWGLERLFCHQREAPLIHHTRSKSSLTLLTPLHPTWF